MRVEFRNDDLRRLFEEESFRLSAVGPDLTKAYRKRVQMVLSASDERDLSALRSNHFEKLKGDREGQHSLKLNDQWRLIVEIEPGIEGKKVVVVEIVDYH
ncbi:MAG TPA: type II toxin-antitoxin system RelE/ParE family toxin [Acidimicrobiia bacterium]|nr:type II toxin-antitoxin system RelE/ParE family toxin [Acidimicrobiia bacterium]